MKKAIVEQFKHPRGALGRLAAWIMAHRESNIQRNEWVVSLLGIRPQDRVLEIGFGPGVALAHAAELAHDGLVVGVDHSELIVQQAANRNAEAVAAGRMTLIHGTAETAIGEAACFDRVYAVNVAQFWDTPAETLANLRRAMAPEGIIAIAFQPRNRAATDEDAERAGSEYARLLKEAGFREVRVEYLDLSPQVVCALGRAPSSGLESALA